MSDILSVGSMPIRDDYITKKEFHSYSPYVASFRNNDEIRIAIQSQDLYVLPSESYIALDVVVTNREGAAHANANGSWSSFPAAHLFSEIRYEINNIEVDRIKNPGITSRIKYLTAFPEYQDREGALVAFYDNRALALRTYSFVIPLYYLFGFCDDYKKIIMNAKHELILVRSRTDVNAYECATESFNINVTKVQWKIPHIKLADHAKVSMLKYLERKQTITVPYRSWDLYEIPQLPQSARHVWSVKSTSQISKPRYVMFVLQTNRQIVSRRSDEYDNCNVTDVKLHLNSECYPYENYNSDFVSGNCQDLCAAFLRIQKSYYPQNGGFHAYTYSYENFNTSPIFAFDCSRSDDSLIGGAVDVRLEINASANIPANTAAYCLIIYENQFEYSPFSGIVVKST